MVSSEEAHFDLFCIALITLTIESKNKNDEYKTTTKKYELYVSIWTI